MKDIGAVWRIALLILAVLAIGAMAPSVAQAQTKTNAAVTDDYFNLVEVNVFGGFTNYGRVDAGLGTSLGKGGVVGARLTENIFDHFGLEQSYAAYSSHDLEFFSPVRGRSVAPFQTHVYQGAMNALAYFTPRESKIRPFLTAGFGVAVYSPTHLARQTARSLDPSLGFGNLSRDTKLQGNYGAGLKWQVSPRVGFRADVRGLIGPNPRFGLPDSNFPANSLTANNVYIPPNHWQQGVQATAGLTFYFGRLSKPAPPPPPPPPPPPVVRPEINAGAISASATSVCPGETITFTANASVSGGHSVSYQWSVDGRPQGGNSSTFSYVADGSGSHSIGLRVSDTASENAASAVTVAAINITVRNYSRPVVSSVTANPTSMERGQTSSVQATASGSECSGALTYSWAASEGAISGSGANATYNSSSVSFNESDRTRPQSKPVTITATVTDSKGGSGTGSTNVTVNLPASVKHFGDILFPKDSSRVNNCGKRILIEQLYPLLTANPNFDVVLVGHIDSAEAPKSVKSAKGRNLDRDRVMNTAAVLSGGTGTCTALDTSRIKGVWVGATQEAEFVPTSCAVSTTPPKERKGAEVSGDEAKNRRVEIWLVPKGLGLPASAKDAKDLPEPALKKLGCPK
ncbi:MAG TPA: outer membrane beta-barrel protein [Bryobacteraceae bacterium]|nr:outer membrane beta-barrel protein [Bryobacteraceae bacterium]